jgi:hypothetical protein
MSPNPNQNPWDSFRPVGDEESKQPRRGAWTAWIWLMIGTTIIGGVMGLMISCKSLTGYTRRPYRTFQRADTLDISDEQIDRIMQRGAMIGGGLGFFFGGVLCLRSVLGRGREEE